jgi:hypothetical protein
MTRQQRLPRPVPQQRDVDEPLGCSDGSQGWGAPCSTRQTHIGNTCGRTNAKDILSALHAPTVIPNLAPTRQQRLPPPTHTNPALYWGTPCARMKRMRRRDTEDGDALRPESREQQQQQQHCRHVPYPLQTRRSGGRLWRRQGGPSRQPPPSQPTAAPHWWTHRKARASGQQSPARSCTKQQHKKCGTSGE